MAKQVRKARPADLTPRLVIEWPTTTSNNAISAPRGRTVVPPYQQPWSDVGHI
jgi:hypothetical protein